ncbi:PREDICTED: putative uncharacterized protein CXorf58 homolog, partial [Dipodomys ordii]|uniref:Uncharacterized protein n=1 Tax=Dipodomys ordii TaxID=10020 RepID=A0A1S3FZD3_DIPOR
IIIRKLSAQIIQRNWLTYLDKSLFRLLKHTICAAEYFASYEILKKVSPLEAQLVKDPSMKYKVRFRFNGENFPPYIVFKIFLQTDSCKCKYFSGKNVLMASNEGMCSAYNMMGKKKFYQQIMEDERYYQKFKVTDQKDIVTQKDYVQYDSHSPFYLQMKLAFLRTSNDKRENCSSLSRVCSLYRPYQQTADVKLTTRYPKLAQMRVDKMKKGYVKDKEAKMYAKTVQKTVKPSEKPIVIGTTVFSTPSFDIVKVERSTSDESEQEENKLFKWYQDLSVHRSSLL